MQVAEPHAFPASQPHVRLPASIRGLKWMEARALYAKYARGPIQRLDTFGHAAGDAVLRTVAETLRQGTRASAKCGRLGGDEFLMVITHVSAENIELIVNRFREQFSSLSFSFSAHSISLTATFGAAGIESDQGRSFSELLRSADEMLYEAKRGGRNCVRMRLVKTVEELPQDWRKRHPK
jgi:diguanylate cyclase (GGDEF)-like protein